MAFHWTASLSRLRGLGAARHARVDGAPFEQPIEPEGSASRVRPQNDRVLASRWIEQRFDRSAPVDKSRVRALFDQYLFVVGPAGRSLFELELRAQGLWPSNMSEHGLEALVEGLSARIPEAAARARFLARAADLDHGY